MIQSKFTIEDGKLVRRGSTNQQGVTAIREVKGNVQIMVSTDHQYRSTDKCHENVRSKIL